MDETSDVKVYTLNKVFNASKIKERVESYVNNVYCNTYENRKTRKAFKNQLLDIIKKENDHIKDNLRIIERKKNIVKKRKRREYKTTPYVEFCREMKRIHGAGTLSGKIQQMWREKCNRKPIVKVVVEKVKPQEQKDKEYNEYMDKLKEQNPDINYGSDSDSDESQLSI